MPKLLLINTLSFLAISSFSLPVLASNPASSNQPPPSNEVQLKRYNVGPYLGIRVDTLSKEMAAQMPEDILLGEGIMVSGFAEDSSSRQQGVQLYDILLKFNDVVLKHPQTFIQLVKNSKIGAKATLTLVRQGKIMTLPITINSQKYPLDEDQLDYQFNLQVLGYDGYIVKQLSKNFFEAQIRYLAPDGVVRKKVFKAPYNVILAQIRSAPDLSFYAKKKLEQLITKRKNDEDGWFGDMMPFSDGNFF